MDECFELPPRLIRMMQTSEAMDKAIGVNMHAARPALPILERKGKKGSLFYGVDKS